LRSAEGASEVEAAAAPGRIRRRVDTTFHKYKTFSAKCKRFFPENHEFVDKKRLFRKKTETACQISRSARQLCICKAFVNMFLKEDFP
jgi:hypothetical protein